MYMYLVIGNIGVCCIELKYNVLRYCVYDHVCVTAMLQELHSMFHVWLNAIMYVVICHVCNTDICFNVKVRLVN